MRLLTGSDPVSFDHLPEHYDRLAWLLGGELQAWLGFHLIPGHRAVDLGCGTGVHTELLADRYSEVLAVDISAPMLAHAYLTRTRPNITWAHRDLRTVTPHTDGHFDTVFSAYVLHHIPDTDFDDVLAGIRALAAPGGLVVLVDLADTPHSRTWFTTRAARALTADLARRRRPARQAWELFRLSVNPAWLTHQTTDRPLPPGQFETRYTAAFPGAQFTTFDRARLMTWTRPTDTDDAP